MKLLSSKQAAEFLGISSGTLENWRINKYGPPYMKYGNLVKYDEEDIVQWLKTVAKGQPPPKG